MREVAKFKLDCSFWKFLLITLITVLVGSASAMAAERDVYPGGSIQTVIDASASGDVVIVHPGLYLERITLGEGKDITVRSENPDDPATVAGTIIDGQQGGTVVTFYGSNGVLSGVTVQNGNSSGILVTKSGITGGWCEPTIRNCLITGNSGYYGYGGGICVNTPAESGTCAPVIENCTISGNTASVDGGGIYGEDWATITNCTITQNSASLYGGGIYGARIVTNCVVANNSARYNGAILGGATVTNCTVVNNSATYGAAIETLGYNVTNCIIWANSPAQVLATYVTYCDVQGGYTGAGNINADPLFVDAVAGDYHLSAASPCINAGDNYAPNLPATDMDGNPRIVNGIVDMGAYEYIPDGGLPTVSITAIAGASEPSEEGRFTVARTGDTGSEMTVYYNVLGTATNGTDYVTLAGSVAIAAGASSADIVITPIDDSSVEGSETVQIDLASNPAYLVNDSARSATIDIADNDLPTVTVIWRDPIRDPIASEPGADDGCITFYRTGATGAALTVNYTVNGTAASGADYKALSGSVTIPVDFSYACVYVYPVNDAIIEPDETVVLTISSNDSYTVGSPSSGTVTIKDNDTQTVTITVSSNAAEPATNGYFKVSRAGDTTLPLTVTYTVNGTATAGTDYTALSGTVTIPASQSYSTVKVAPKDDTLKEGQETVVATISSGAYIIGSPGSATMVIKDNDVPTVSITASDATAVEYPVNTGTFRVTRIEASATPLTVYYTVSGTATNGVDYNALSGSVTIPAGAANTYATITVTPKNDALKEKDETVIVTIPYSASYNVNPPGTATVTIQDDDMPRVKITAPDASASEPGTDTGRFTITRTGSTASALTVYYTYNGTAVKGSDYTASPDLVGSISIPAGSSSASITITPIDDAEAEDTESVKITLTDNGSYNLGSPTNATVYIYDNEPQDY